MKCPECGAPEGVDGERKHAPDCPFVTPATYTPEARTGNAEPAPALSCAAEPPKQAPMRVMQFVGSVELSPEGEPLRVTVLIQGGLATTCELGEDAELSIGDAVDLALTRAGRRLLSVDVS